MTKENPLGKVTINLANGRTRVDDLFRVSLKAFIYNKEGQLLVVKEAEKDWGAPGGGMEHGDTFESALARELDEEIGYTGRFTIQPIGVEEPQYLPHIDCMQLWVGFIVELLDPYEPTLGIDAKGIQYVDAEELFKSKDPQTHVSYKFHKRAQEILKGKQ